VSLKGNGDIECVVCYIFIGVVDVGVGVDVGVDVDVNVGVRYKPPISPSEEYTIGSNRVDYRITRCHVASNNTFTMP
jgi:hypothetical protein